MNPPAPSDPKNPPEITDETTYRQLNLRLDPEHDAALCRISKFEKISKAEALRKLIRIADQMVSGDKSPFAARLEHLLLAKVG